MIRHKILCVASATIMTVGSGVLAPVALADGENCVASDFEELKACLVGDAVNITTTNTIVVSGEDVDEVLTINKDIIGANNLDVFHVENGAKLTLRGNGVITAGRYGAVADGADLIIDGVYIDATNFGCYGVYAKDNGHVTMESGQVVADYAAFAGNNSTGNMNFYINGGLLKSNRYPAIYMPGQVNLVIRGGTLDGGIVARMGQIEIENGTINKQATPVDSDGLDVNYGGMPSMTDEAITLVAGSYKSTTTDYGNDMNVRITGKNTQVNGDIVLYDLGNTAEGYEQNVNIVIQDGRLTDLKTKFTVDEIGFALRNGYTAGLNNEAGRINIRLQGGRYTTMPAEEDITSDSEAEFNAETGVYEIFPKQVDLGPEGQVGIETDWSDEAQLPVFVDFNEEFFVDRKAVLSATEVDAGELVLVGDGELIGAFGIDLFDRNKTRIEVDDVDMTIYIDIDEETYNQLARYDKIEVVYFNEEGSEVERIDARLQVESADYVNPETNETETWAYYWIEFNTTHLSTYGIVGVSNEESNEELPVDTSVKEDKVTTPDTGIMTAGSLSTSVMPVATATMIGLIVLITGFTFLRRKH